MAKTKKSSKQPSKRPKKAAQATQADLAAAVASAVDITEIRLYSGSAQLGEAAGEVSVTYRHRARVNLHDSDPSRVRVFTDFVLEQSNDEDGDGQTPADSQGERLSITATFRLDYRVPDAGEFTDEQLSAFGQVNGVYNAWPFWREYVYSTMARLGLPPITMPVLHLGEPEDR